MARPGDAEWSVLQLDSDPVPGDPESFEEITRAYQELARTTQEAHDLLATGGQLDVGQGKAMEAFRDLIGKLPPRLDRMAHSYAAAADAYLRYLPSLEEAQTMSMRALDQARQASGDQGSAQAALSSAQAALTALTGNAEAAKDAKDRADDDVTAAQRRADDARQALDQARALLGQATALRDQAARSAAETLRQLAKDAPQRSLWEKIAEAFHAFIEFLRSTVIEWITLVLDALSVIASFIFPPLGEAIGLLSGAIDLAGAVLGGDPAEIGMAAGGMALGLIPGGRIAARLMKFALKGGKALPGTVADGVRNSTKGLGGGTGTRSVDNAGKPGAGTDTVVTRLGPGNLIKGKFADFKKKVADFKDKRADKQFERDLDKALEKREKDPSLIFGQTGKGRLKTFHASDVKSVPLHDNNGKQIGVLFPSKPNDNQVFTDWAKTESNLAFGKNLGGQLDISGRKIIRGVPGQEDATFANSNLKAAPWSKLKNDPISVVAHGSPEDAAVTLNNGKVIRVTGAQFAKVLHNDDVFKAAADANPKGSIAMLSCNFGNASGSAGQDFADTMRELGSKRPVFAATDTVQAIRGKDSEGVFTDPGRSIASLAVENDGKFIHIKPN
ncbi:putative T7SS-secreted protein [Micromonospora sp. NPDC023888]|uniref:putative T7SS-secreted protein n=1 Tax=Micromonospora sp. NPDC023888 TaxID=3155607 RepID=UPI0033D0769B